MSVITLKQFLKKIPVLYKNPTRKELCDFLKFDPQKIEWKKYIPTDYYTGIINNKTFIVDNKNFNVYINNYTDDPRIILTNNYEIHKVLDGELSLYNDGKLDLYKRGDVFEFEKDLYYILKKKDKSSNCIILSFIDKSKKL